MMLHGARIWHINQVNIKILVRPGGLISSFVVRYGFNVVYYAYGLVATLTDSNSYSVCVRHTVGVCITCFCFFSVTLVMGPSKPSVSWLLESV